MYFFHSNLDFQIFRLLYQYILKLHEQGNRKAKTTHIAHGYVLFFPNARTPGNSAADAYQGADMSPFAAWPGKYFS